MAKGKGKIPWTDVLNIHYKTHLIGPDLFPPKEAVVENRGVAEILPHHTEKVGEKLAFS